MTFEDLAGQAVLVTGPSAGISAAASGADAAVLQADLHDPEGAGRVRAA